MIAVPQLKVRSMKGTAWIMEIYGEAYPQFVGTAVCDSIGFVIANVDEALRKQMNIPDEFKTVGLIGSRTGAAAQIKAVDDAAKATSAEVISVELPRDTKGWGGHGNFIIIGSRDVSDARRAVEAALSNINKYAGEIYISEAGHCEFQYSPRSYTAINKAFGIPIDKPFGFVCASPAPIGMVISDIALKAADIELVKTLRPEKGTRFSNEVIIIFTGDPSAVKKAVTDARQAGLTLLEKMGSTAPSVTTPYIA